MSDWTLAKIKELSRKAATQLGPYYSEHEYELLLCRYMHDAGIRYYCQYQFQVSLDPKLEPLILVNRFIDIVVYGLIDSSVQPALSNPTLLPRPIVIELKVCASPSAESAVVVSATEQVNYYIEWFNTNTVYRPTGLVIAFAHLSGHPSINNIKKIDHIDYSKLVYFKEI